MRRIKWKDEEYVLVGGNLKEGGAITTPELLAAFELNPAHLFEDGVIRSYGKEVGTVKDIEDLGPFDDTETKEAWSQRDPGEMISSLLTGLLP